MNLQKCVCNYGFYLCTIVACMLMFTSTVYTDAKGQEISVIDICMKQTRFQTYGLTVAEILNVSVSPFLTLFIPILSSIPFVSAYTEERNSNNNKLAISRIGKHCYYTSWWMTAMISGGLAVMLGFMLFSTMMMVLFSFMIEDVAVFLKLCFGMLLYGTISVLPSFIMSAISKNKNLICCLPFIVMSFWYTFLNRYVNELFIQKPIEQAVHITENISFLYPNNLAFVLNESTQPIEILTFYSILAFLSYVLFLIIVGRKVDVSE